MSLLLHPLTITEARYFLAKNHRHRKRITGAFFAIGVAREGEEEPCGIILVGRPVARLLQDGWTAEINRCCTDGTPNACSKLYGAAKRAALALGYKRLVTYTLPEEGGASLRASGFRCIASAGGGPWSRRNRPRVDDHPQQKKIRWEALDSSPPVPGGGA